MRQLGPTVCAVFVAASAAAAPPSWLEVKSAHFTVVTNSGEKAGRRTAWQFEQIHSALVLLWPWAKIDSGRPFFVFAVRDEATLKTLGPEYWEGKRYRPISFGASGREKHFIALRTDIVEPDEIGANPYQSAYWSYVSAVFTRSFPRPLPVWYSRGIAEVMSNTIVRDKELHVGRPIRGNLALLQRAPIPLNEFLAADYRSHWLRQESDAQLFDAQAWALVHYLLFGEKGAHSAKVNRFNQLLYEGTSAEAALKEAFGDMTPYHDRMRGYVQRELFVYMRVPVSLDTRPEAYATRTLSAGEAAVLCGEFLVAMNRPGEARTFAAAAAKADASLPGPWEIEAELLDTGESGEPAKAAYQKATEAGSKRAHVYYRLAQLEWTPNPEKARLEHLATILEKARELDPGRADTPSRSWPTSGWIWSSARRPLPWHKRPWRSSPATHTTAWRLPASSGAWDGARRRGRWPGPPCRPRTARTCAAAPSSSSISRAVRDPPRPRPARERFGQKCSFAPIWTLRGK